MAKGRGNSADDCCARCLFEVVGDDDCLGWANANSVLANKELVRMARSTCRRGNYLVGAEKKHRGPTVVAGPRLMVPINNRMGRYCASVGGI